VQLLEVFLRKIFDRGDPVLRIFHGDDQFGKLELKRHRVAVLCVLNQEHHQERDDRRSGVDDELPGVAVTEDRSGDGPYDDRQRRQ
jgi:hypothetical protein